MRRKIYLVYVFSLACILFILPICLAGTKPNTVSIFYPREIPVLYIKTTKELWRREVVIPIQFKVPGKPLLFNVTVKFDEYIILDTPPKYNITIIYDLICNGKEFCSIRHDLVNGPSGICGLVFGEEQIPASILNEGANELLIKISITGRGSKGGQCIFNYTLLKTRRIPSGIEKPCTYVKVRLTDTDGDGVANAYDVFPYFHNGLAYVLLAIAPLPVVLRKKEERITIQ